MLPLPPPLGVEIAKVPGLGSPPRSWTSSNTATRLDDTVIVAEAAAWPSLESNLQESRSRLLLIRGSRSRSRSRSGRRLLLLLAASTSRHG